MDLSPTTMRTYRAQIKQTIRPPLGKVVAQPPDRQAPRRPLRRHEGPQGGRRRRSATTTPSSHRRSTRRVRWGWVRENVAEQAKPPRVSQRRVSAPSVDVVRSVIEAAEERDPRLAPLLMLAALTGMRRGELCALRWTDVDLDRGELEVSRSVVVVPAGWPRRRTKTDRSRTVALDEVGVRPAHAAPGQGRRVGTEG